MTILLLGRDGQLGRALAPALAALAPVTAVGREDCDLTRVADEPALAQELLRSIRPRLVVNAAAYTAVDRAESESEAAMAVNARAPGVLAQAAREAGALFVHYSTDYVFDGRKAAAYDEDDATNPINCYGRSKRDGELAVAASGAAHLILRTSWLYGPKGQNFLRTMLRLGRERERLSVVDDQIGAPTSTAALAAATVAILRRGGADAATHFAESGGLVHVACRGTTSWHSFAEAIFAGARARGWPLAVRTVTPIPTADYPTPARRPTRAVLALDRLAEHYGVITPPWRDALDAVLDGMTR